MALSRLETIIAQLITDVSDAWGIESGNLFLNRFPESIGPVRKAAIIIKEPIHRGGPSSGVMSVSEDFVFGLHLWLPISDGNRALLDQMNAARDLSSVLKPTATDTDGDGTYTRVSTYAGGVMGNTAIPTVELPPIEDISSGCSEVTIIFTGTSWELE